MAEQLRTSIAASGSVGLDVATLDERQRAVLDTLDGVVIDGRPRSPGRHRGSVRRPPVPRRSRRAGGFAPPAADDVDRSELRELVRRGLLVERDGDRVPRRHDRRRRPRSPPALLVEHPEGFTIAQFRDATGASRKYALPLVAELDARAVTRRRGDLRIGGPHLPERVRPARTRSRTPMTSDAPRGSPWRRRPAARSRA